ncbi:MAG TPA: hypothetical protein DHW71_07060 [Gammaproteobacteria bacterium]|nr:hypothetical protein [Gammaproteobacteria bacterium]
MPRIQCNNCQFSNIETPIHIHNQEHIFEGVDRIYRQHLLALEERRLTPLEGNVIAQRVPVIPLSTMTAPSRINFMPRLRSILLGNIMELPRADGSRTFTLRSPTQIHYLPLASELRTLLQETGDSPNNESIRSLETNHDESEWAPVSSNLAPRFFNNLVPGPGTIPSPDPVFTNTQRQNRRTVLLQIHPTGTNRNQSPNYTDFGKEYSDLIRVLKMNPNMNSTWEYKNSEATDAGGVTRQVLNNALEQFCQSFSTLTQTGSFRLLPVKHDLNKCHELGLLLGHISKVKMAIDLHFDLEIYSKGLQALTLIQNENFKTIIPAFNETNALTQFSQDQMTKLFSLFDASTYNHDTITHMQSLPQEELEDTYSTTLAPYLAIAKGLKEVQMYQHTDAQAFKETVEGAQNLHEAVPQALKVHNTCFSEFENNTLAQALKSMLADFTHRELQLFCKSITGSGGMVTGDSIYFNVHNSPSSGLLSANPCGKSLSLSLPVLKTLFESSQTGRDFSIFDSLSLSIIKDGLKDIGSNVLNEL